MYPVGAETGGVGGGLHNADGVVRLEEMELSE
jgi:hypothetical protein